MDRRAPRILAAALALSIVAAGVASAPAATSLSTHSSRGSGEITGASQAVCTPSPCTQGPAPGSSPHGDYTVRADNGTGTVVDRYYSVYRPKGLTNASQMVLLF